MATITAHATANSIVSGATLSVTGITAAVGDFLILECMADNAGAAGVSSTSAAITDATGNTWTRQSETTVSPGGVANDGGTLSIWTCLVTVALVAASIDINFSPNTTSKVALLQKIAPAAGEVPYFLSAGAGATGVLTGTWAAPTVSVPQGSTIFGAVGNESGNAQTADSDTTDGSWSADHNALATTGTNGTSQAIGAQWKTVTATGNQTYNRTSGAAREWAANYIIIAYASTGSASGTADARAKPSIDGTASATADARAKPSIGGSASGTGAALGVPESSGLVVVWAAITERADRASGVLAHGWPTFLPAPTLQGYSFIPASSVKRTPMEIGAPRVYRKTKKPPIEVAVAWQVNAEQQALLDGFQKSILREGQDPFSITLAFPSGLATAVAKFKEKLAIRGRGGPRWQTTAMLELLSRPMMTDAELAAIIGSGTDWPSTFLPAPTLGSWELTPKPAVARSDDLPGYPDARQRSRNSTTEVPAAWMLTAVQAAIFDAFFHHRGKDGAQWFAFPLVQAIGTVSTKVRFLGEMDWTPLGGSPLKWSVSAPMEIRERRVYSAAEVTEALGA
jgi:hypothetical protein